MAEGTTPNQSRKMTGILGWIEWAGNKLPDPAMLFVWALFIVWGLSHFLASADFSDTIDPRTKQPIVIKDQITGTALTSFLVNMVHIFVSFPPLGVVLVALLGVGVAEHTGFIDGLIKGLLNITPRILITPMLILVGIISHSAGDTGYVLVVPLGGVIFYAAGRHPLAGIVVAFAAVSGGFSANFLPSGLDSLLQGFTQGSTNIIDPNHRVDILCNYYFTSLSSILIVLLGWFITDAFIEPRLRRDTLVDGNKEDMPHMAPLTSREKNALIGALLTLAACFGLFLYFLLQDGSPLQEEMPQPGGHGPKAPAVMQMIIPLIFLFFLIPGVVYGYLAGTVRTHRDIVKGMSKSMSTMGYYLVLAFFAALFTHAFRESNLGALSALKGAEFLKSINMPAQGVVVGVILITGTINLLIGSASAKWALLAPIFVPMLMQLGLSPELTQAAYRIGDSSTNIITPLMPYFLLVVTFAQRYVKDTGIGTLIALMLPYSLTFLVFWTGFLLLLWNLNIPLGSGVSYYYPAP